MIKVGDMVDALPAAKKRYFNDMPPKSAQKWPFLVKKIEECDSCELFKETCPGRVNEMCFGFTDEGYILFCVTPREWDNDANN